MFKKLIPLVLLVFVGACAHMQPANKGAMCNMPCCEKCECCKAGNCECCKSGSGDCCKDGKCCCDGNTAGDECPMCAKAAREYNKKSKQ